MTIGLPVLDFGTNLIPFARSLPQSHVDDVTLKVDEFATCPPRANGHRSPANFLRVEFFAGGEFFGFDTTVPYERVFDPSATRQDVPYVITATARDASGVTRGGGTKKVKVSKFAVTETGR